MTTDPVTNLPALPEDRVWRVKRTYGLSERYFYKIQLRRRRRWLGVTFYTTVEFDWIYGTTNFNLCYPEEITDECIYKAALTVLEGFNARQKRVTDRSFHESRLGYYPPHKLGGH